MDAPVVPRAGTWIETPCCQISAVQHLVVPRAGTWIETFVMSIRITSYPVVPRAGTWIETSLFCNVLVEIASFPVRERGLKPEK